ncbi:uncharacterized protein LOC131923079 isoform X3 [Peromyscus eremicus]|uniref:uncharacterized protein LOC131923079 isoform X3 n=1 Tax=Peromyscus eremicus TaxID=42410 RepID=UPI0027DD4117|nr:uncharacterized protein LOC131923079 isoform X3 [Peromyscus eremicus]
MASDSTVDLRGLFCSWEEDRKLVLRGWSLVFISLATLLVFSVVDGQMAYVHGPYTGFIGLWIDCRRHKCANVGQVTVCRRLNKIDYIFSFLSIGIGLLILLSLMLFVINCNRLRLRPQVSYLLVFYLCWCASVLMLWAGTLSFLNQVRRGSYSTPIMERRVSYFRWALRHQSQQQSNLDQSSESIQNQSAATSQDTGKSRQPDASTSVPVTLSPSDLP